ncbi:GNAT family N-acetyltransferase [Salaquimonas pukyongi]|uniref:GNAT family N-acetyltransferase n=1 Tax=Salaquimonas pukyongi TaxID=2712698 RepID=UPI00096BAEB9|nr:GNAT family N-acetyltransferase [Salaquimonas pukyongi]
MGRQRPGFNVEEPTSQDLAACGDIHRESFSRAWEDGTLANMLKAPGTVALVARAHKPASHPVRAFLMYRVAGGEAEVLTVATARKARRHGAARVLMEEMIRRCLADRLEEIFLEVDAGNQAAIGLYRKLGFTQVGERAGYYRQGQDETAENSKPGNALIMRLDLRD